jgi:trk system potassium uptake protein TrkA
MKFGVIGLGRFGYQLAVSLAEQGCEVVAVDRNQQLIESIRDHVTQSVCINVTDEQSLIDIGVGELDTVVVATGESFAQTVLLTTLLKKNLNVPYVIARAVSNAYEEILKLVGADRVFVIERDMGVKVAHTLSMPLADLVPITEKFAVTTLQAPTEFVGRTIEEIKPLKNYKVSCIAVQKGDDIILIGKDYIVLEHDKLMFAGHKKHLKMLTRI